MILYQNLRRPEAGQPLKVSWGNSVVDSIKSITPISGKNVRLTRTDHGTIIDVDLDAAKKGASKSTSETVPTGDITPAGPDQEGPDEYGITASFDVVTEMTYNATTHKFEYKTRKMSFSRGKLVQLDQAVNHLVFTAVGESY
jgi:hypothetical protein